MKQHYHAAVVAVPLIVPAARYDGARHRWDYVTRVAECGVYSTGWPLYVVPILLAGPYDNGIKEGPLLYWYVILCIPVRSTAFSAHATKLGGGINDKIEILDKIGKLCVCVFWKIVESRN